MEACQLDFQGWHGMQKKTMADCREELEGEEIKRFIADDNGGADGVGRVGYCGGFFLC